MKKHQHTDRIIKEKMEDYSMETPMHLFAGIAEALDAEVTPVAPPPKNSWKNNYWVFVFLAVAIGGSSIWFLTSDQETKNDKNATMSALSLDNVNPNLEGNSVLNKNEKNHQSTIDIEQKNVIANIEVSNNTENLKKATSNEEVAISGNTTLINESNTATTENGSTSTFDPHVSFETTTPQNILSQKGGATLSDDQSIQSSNSALGNAINAIPKTDDQLVEQPITGTLNQHTLVKKNKSATIFHLPKLNQLANSSIYHDRPYQLAIEPTCGIKPDGSKIKFTTSLDLFFSPDFANQMLEYKSDDFKEHAQLRRERERPYYSFNTGVRVNFLTEFGWAIRTGLVYTQINEIFETNHTEVEAIVDGSGNQIEILGIRSVNIRNKYKMIDIPIIFGYEASMKNFDLNVNGGVYLNLRSSQSGAFFSPIDDQVVYFTKGHPDDYDVFKNNIGLSIFMGVGFNFDLTNALNASKRTQLMIEPHVRFYPKSFALDNYILNQKYFSTGVMIGLRRDL